MVKIYFILINALMSKHLLVMFEMKMYKMNVFLQIWVHFALGTLLFCVEMGSIFNHGE